MTPANAISGRISMVDGLRGWALLGLFLVHCVERFELYWLEPWNDASLSATFFLFGGKAYALFALLFGFSFATIMGNERRRGGDFTWRFVWRLVLLLGFGTLHAMIYRGEILQVLAVVGLLLIPFDRVKSDRALLALAALAFVQVPLFVRLWAADAGQGWALADPLYFGSGDLRILSEGTFWQATVDNITGGTVAKWSYYLEAGRVTQIVGMFFVGMVAQRRDWLAKAGDHRGACVAVLFAGAALWTFGMDLAALVIGDPATPAGQRIDGQIGGLWAALGGTAVHAALFALVWHSPLHAAVGWLAAPGRMTLTLYLGQSLLGATLLFGWGFGLWQAFSPTVMMLGGLALFAAQAVFAELWFRRYRFGPLEWLWRAATRGTWSMANRLPNPA
ncbi:MAG: DUF418 domain-containing protein [Alteraurantiacibacter sp.]